MKYIYQHLGLGDHIICNGLVRQLIEENSLDNYCMFVKSHNLDSVSFMYRDLNNLSFVVGDDIFANNLLSNINKEKKIIIGFDSMIGISWDNFFYYQHNVSFEKRWSNFRIVRDADREEKLFNLLNPDNEDYILIHSSGSDKIDRIDYTLVNDKYKKIFVSNYTNNIFDYIKLIEKSKEIHCIESSFHVLVDSLSIKSNLFFHTLKKSRGFQHKIKNNWKIV